MSMPERVDTPEAFLALRLKVRELEAENASLTEMVLKLVHWIEGEGSIVPTKLVAAARELVDGKEGNAPRKEALPAEVDTVPAWADALIATIPETVNYFEALARLQAIAQEALLQAAIRRMRASGTATETPLPASDKPAIRQPAAEVKHGR